MNPIQADALVGRLRRAAIPQELSDGRVAEMAEVLTPLPFEVCERRVEQWALSVAVDAEGRQAEKWMSTPDHVLAAVGVGARARHLIEQAILDRQAGRDAEVWPSLRENGWELIGPGDPLPRGVGEWHANLGLPLPAGRRVSLALPAAPPTDLATVPEELVGDELRAIGTGLQQRKNAALRRAFEELRDPPAPIAWDRERMPPVLREAVKAAEAAQDQAIQAEQHCIAQERAYRELCAELAERIRESAPDAITARAVVVDLLRRVAADAAYDVIGCADALAEALGPELRVVKCDVERGPKPDEFEDALGPVVGLRLLLKERAS